MTGIVDAFGRPLIRVAVQHPFSEDRVEVDALVDTGFSRELEEPVSRLRLPKVGVVKAAFADGSQVPLDRFSCRVEWFGEVRTLDAFLCSGPFALIGVGLLEDLILHIDYPARTVQLALSSSR